MSKHVLVAVSAVATVVALTAAPASAGEAAPLVARPVATDGAQPWDSVRASAMQAPSQILDKAPATGPVRIVATRADGADLQVVTRTAKTRAAARATIRDLQADPELLAVEIDRHDVRIASTSGADATSDDPRRSQQWALDTLAAEQVWDTTTGAGVTVAIVDTGVSTHEDLAESRILAGTDLSSEGGNGRNDGNGHGTHCAGIVGATLNNQTGIASLAPSVSILPVKVLDNQGSGWAGDVAAGIEWAVDHGADVISMSLGGTGYSEAQAVAVEYALAHGVVVIAAAGNARQEGSPTEYPGALPGVLAVAATDSADEVAYFSNAGAYVDLSAPGVAILSTLPGNEYASWNGTSMATPYVSASAALVLAEAEETDVDLDPSEVGDLLQVTATDLGPTGRDIDYGHGLVQPLAALSAMAESGSAPIAPTSVSVSGVTAHTAAASWSHAGTDVVGFRVTATPAAGGASVQCVSARTARQCGLTALQPDTTYQGVATAWNVRGQAHAAPVSFRTATAPPDAGDTVGTATPMPGSMTVLETLESDDDVDVWSFSSTRPGAVTVTLSELPADYDLALFDALANDLAWSEDWGTDDEVIELDLPAGRYYAVILAFDPVQPDEPYRLTAAVPAALPAGAPSGLTAMPGNRSATIQFTAPPANGSAITNYQYSLNNGAWTARTPAGTASPLVVSGLTNGTSYAVRLRADNAAGPGAASAPVTVTPRTVPGAPTALAASPGDRSATIRFTAAPSNGAPVTTYQYSLNGAAWVARSPAGASSPVVVRGLTNGYGVWVRLRAVNAAGAGAPSVATHVVPSTVPAAPRSLRASVLGGGRAQLTWQPPASTGGSAITGYRLRWHRTGQPWSAWRSATSAARSLPMTGAAGRYDVQAVAVNARGTSPVAATAFVMR